MASKKNPDLTRAKLLEAGFEEVYQHGFRAASLASILSNAGVTKGALYHHFPNKTALGYALVDEVIGGFMVERWVGPLRDAEDPVTVLQRMTHEVMEENVDDVCSCGCPLANLALEMSGEDEGFRERIAALVSRLEGGIAEALRRGQENGKVRDDIDPDQVAGFFFAACEGIMGVTKNSQDPEVLGRNFAALRDYLETLRPVEVH